MILAELADEYVTYQQLPGSFWAAVIWAAIIVPALLPKVRVRGRKWRRRP